MKYGFVLPGGTATQQLEHAVLADQNGWDGVFVWEAAYGVDPWTLLAAMAQLTEHVKLGTMLTPLAWRRPWKVASQAVTLDQLSNGRAIVSIGLGAVAAYLGNTGETLERRARAQMLDEGIDIMQGLWQGDLSFTGKHYNVDLSSREDLSAVAQPVQPRIPVWVVAAWPRMPSMRRVLRCDGILPAVMRPEAPPDVRQETTPNDIAEIAAWLRENGEPGREYDIVVEGPETPADDASAAREIVRPWAEAGGTWWIEARWGMPHHSDERMQQVRDRLLAGPPHAD